jgi:hypothetical protein
MMAMGWAGASGPPRADTCAGSGQQKQSTLWALVVFRLFLLYTVVTALYFGRKEGGNE